MSIIQGNSIESGVSTYQIERSLRFNSADSAYLNRTPASAGNRKTWTIALWFKRTAFGSLTKMFSAGAPSGAFTFFETVTDNTFKFGYFNGTTTAWSIQTTQVFRDPSAWMHMVLAVDTTQATNTNRIKLYINGSQVTALTATYPSQNTDTDFNNTVAHQIGNGVYNSTEPFNGYMADFYLIDGSALDPTSFGEYNSDTGVWQPKAYTGSYGTNGFYLDFADNSSTTALGYDAAGSNNWTPNNFSVTAGAGNDSLVDTPTNYGTDTGAGGEVRGNYATLNPLLSAGGTTSNGNLQVTTTAGVGHSRATIAIPNSGKWYAEFTAISASTSTDYIFGIVGSETAEASYGYNQTPSYSYTAFGERIVNGSFTSSFYSSFTTGDIIGCAVDLDTNQLTWYKNGTAQTAISIANGSYFWIVSDASGSRQITAGANFGQRPFAYTAPSGFKALCTQNLPEPTVVDGGDYFETKIWTGDGTSSRAITGLGFQPGLVWGKVRSTNYGNVLYDAVRGANKRLSSNSTDAEDTLSPNTNLISFDSDGFTVGSAGVLNESSQTYVGWAWKANGTGVSNTDGTITSTVSANTTAGFSIVTYTGTGSNATIGHGLGSALSFLILKRRDASSGGGSDWPTWHKALTGDQYLSLSGTGGYGTLSSVWNGSVPTSSVFSTGTAIPAGSYVAYCFTPVSGYSAFGSYTGNGSSDGVFVYTGFTPRWLMWKRTDASGTGWVMYDTAREESNLVNLELEAQSSAAEFDTTSVSPGYPCDILSNGFKLRGSRDTGNASGGTYIYAAFAENPFKYALAR